MAFSRVKLADNYDNDVLALPHVSVPPGERLRVSKPSTPPDLIGLGQRLRDPVPVLGQQVRMPLRDVALTLVRQLYRTLEVGARISGHPTSPFTAEPLVRLTSRCSGRPSGPPLIGRTFGRSFIIAGPPQLSNRLELADAECPTFVS